MKNLNFVVITPARDEEDHIEKTLSSMVNQSILPRQWVIVDDGSSDRTTDIVEKYVDGHPWIKLVRREDRGARKQGGGVIEAFYEGFRSVEGLEWDFIVKLDADVSFDSDYFESCFKKFSDDPKLGVGGGLIYNSDGENRWVEKTMGPRFHVRGATKIYRKDCWVDIAPLTRAPGWDTVDEVKANMKGWSTYTFVDIPLVHHRYTGSADGAWKNAVKNGRANYISGYHVIFMIFKCAKRLFQSPFLIGSSGLMWGYISGYLYGKERITDSEFISYIRKQQIRRITFRKSIWG
jgi:biofilm PGA synthesis N-glycosyltransferase PgaC